MADCGCRVELSASLSLECVVFGSAVAKHSQEEICVVVKFLTSQQTFI